MGNNDKYLRRTMYLRVEIYLPIKYPINAVVKVCHKPLYAKIGIWTCAAEI